MAGTEFSGYGEIYIREENMNKMIFWVAVPREEHRFSFPNEGRVASKRLQELQRRASHSLSFFSLFKEMVVGGQPEPHRKILPESIYIIVLLSNATGRATAEETSQPVLQPCHRGHHKFHQLQLQHLKLRAQWGDWGQSPGPKCLMAPNPVSSVEKKKK